MDGIRATPYINPLLGSANDIIGGLLGYMRDPRRTQQLQGLAGLLESTGIPKTVERLAYGEPLTNIQRANVPLLRPETAEALLTVAPVPPVAGRATMAAGRAGERMAERMVPQIMERGGMPAGLLEGMSSRTVSPLTVYHGSPAKFTKFDPTKIGSGEGAQAYGYGHYVAQSPEVAKMYRDVLSRGEKQIYIQGRRIEPEMLDAFESNIVNAKGYGRSKSDYLEELEMNGVSDSSIQKLSKLWDEMGDVSVKDVLPENASIYEIDLPDEQIAKMLDWDKPLSEQTPFVKEALQKAISFMPEDRKALFKDYPLQDFQLGRDLKEMIGERYMQEAGIPGIRYLDEGSRGAGEGTSNFVVFPGGEDLLTILKRNGGLLGP